LVRFSSAESGVMVSMIRRWKLGKLRCRFWRGLKGAQIPIKFVLSQGRGSFSMHWWWFDFEVPSFWFFVVDTRKVSFRRFHHNPRWWSESCDFRWVVVVESVKLLMM
jgi:hypothetical protein